MIQTFIGNVQKSIVIDEDNSEPLVVDTDENESDENENTSIDNSNDDVKDEDDNNEPPNLFSDF